MSGNLKSAVRQRCPNQGRAYPWREVGWDQISKKYTCLSAKCALNEKTCKCTFSKKGPTVISDLGFIESSHLALQMKRQATWLQEVKAKGKTRQVVHETTASRAWCPRPSQDTWVPLFSWINMECAEEDQFLIPIPSAKIEPIKYK